MSYRMEEVSRGDMAAADPFGGHGIFVSLPDATAAEIIVFLAARLEMTVPAVAWDGIGAWVDPEATGIAPADLRRLLEAPAQSSSS